MLWWIEWIPKNSCHRVKVTGANKSKIPILAMYNNNTEGDVGIQRQIAIDDDSEVSDNLRQTPL